jgi:glycosyltransferase involved in cell wall biosynthesis
MGADKDLLLQGSDIFVLPSFSENFGIAVAEAMAAGVPVIVTPDVQIAPDIAEANAGLVVEGELDTLVRAIQELLISPNRRIELGENGKRLVSRRYSWSAIALNLTSVYEAIGQGKRFPVAR